MAVKKPYRHKKANEIAVIKSPFNEKTRILYGDDWSLSDWNKIIKFWTNHPTYTIGVE